MPSQGSLIQGKLLVILMNLIFKVVSIRVGISTVNQINKGKQSSSRPAALATTIPVRCTTWRRTASIGWPGLTIRAAVATCSSSRTMSIHYSVILLVTGFLFAAQRRGEGNS